MKKLAVILVVCLSSFLLSQTKNVNEEVELDDSKISEQLVSIVTSIIRGEDYSGFKTHIAPEAYFINDKMYESIFEVLSNSKKQSRLIEGKETEIQFYSLHIPDNPNAAYLVLETKFGENQILNWHSIYFYKDKNDIWQILSWHKS